jgi:uncharacterized beta-barrel protein YwiB (DUF1934 family)
MKLLLLPLILVCLMVPVFARECQVDGISDSPQKLTCQFQDEKIALTCQRGTYFLNQARVTLAYHLEVEEGAVPLVFKTSESELTVLLRSKVDIVAELTTGRSAKFGQCY